MALPPRHFFPSPRSQRLAVLFALTSPRGSSQGKRSGLIPTKSGVGWPSRRGPLSKPTRVPEECPAHKPAAQMHTHHTRTLGCTPKLPRGNLIFSRRIALAEEGQRASIRWAKLCLLTPADSASTVDRARERARERGNPSRSRGGNESRHSDTQKCSPSRRALAQKLSSRNPRLHGLPRLSLIIIHTSG